ncbi:MAG: hypothetical protein F7C38_00525 [Desulfurococcales archaeon]|nr:hypothetical protein [Desulfurococcales archaeon]
MSSPELLSEIREIKERLARLESMLRFIMEKGIEEEEPLPDEIEAIESKDELIDLNEVKRKLMEKS